ncbi:MAG: adenylyl-sulfate kinase [Patescibacteria group bacterium]
MQLAEILGWIATFLFTVCYIPQIVKTAQTKTVEGLSFLLLFISFIANIIALGYATLIKQPPLQIKYSLALLFLIICIGLYIRTIKIQRSKKSGSGLVVWFTGLSGSGKTTIAAALKERLERADKRVVVLDGDAVRATAHRHLGFAREDIRENNRLVAELAKKKRLEAEVVLVPIISPYRADRETARRALEPGFIEVFVNCSVDECRQRDTKGLYGKAARGEIDNLIGVSPAMPYEAPEHPEIELRTDMMSVEECVEAVVRVIG